MPTPTSSSALQSAHVKVSSLRKAYTTPAEDLVVLDGINLELSRGESLAVTGPSGSGKSTLLHILGALDSPSSGSVEIDGQNPFRLGERELAAFRNRNIGFVFQDHHLLPQLTAFENVLVPALVGAGVTPQVEAWAKSLLERVGLGARLEHFPAELSGGERQRVAIARALIQRPSLLLCDEPTGNLDPVAANGVRDLFLELHREQNTVLIVVTHSEELASAFGSRLALRGGLART